MPVAQGQIVQFSSVYLFARVRALAGDIVLCSWTGHLTLTVPLSTQVYKWVPANLMLGGSPAMDWHPIQERVQILSSRFMLRKPG